MVVKTVSNNTWVCEKDNLAEELVSNVSFLQEDEAHIIAKTTTE
jgi:hypothetical protein